MLRAFIKYADGRTSKDSSVASLRAAVADRGCVFWLDMSKPDDEEYALLDEVFGFHPLAIEDTIKYVQRPKIESYNHGGRRRRGGLLLHGHPRAGPGDVPGEAADERTRHVRVRSATW